MKHLIAQWTGKVYVPYSQEDMDASKEFLPNQLVKIKATGVKKSRSYQQLKLYWACCRTVGDNLGKDAKEIDFDVKIELRHIKAFRVVNNVTMIEVGSISFDNLTHLMACNYFQRAWPVMAKMIGVTEEVLLANAEGG